LWLNNSRSSKGSTRYLRYPWSADLKETHFADEEKKRASPFDIEVVALIYGLA